MKRSFFFIGALLLAATSSSFAEDGRWSESVLKIFTTIPVQDGGRIKPLDTYARVTLLKLNGKRTYTADNGERMGALPWLLDVLLHPDETRDYRHFNIDNSDVLLAIGVTPRARRDRYSYNELAPARAKLFELAQQFSMRDQKKLNPFERMLLNLAVNLRDFEMLTQYFDFARHSYAVSDDPALRTLFGNREFIALSGALLHRKDLRALMAQGNAAANELFSAVQRHVLTARSLALIPPANPLEKEWFTPSSLFTDANASLDGLETELAHLAALENVVATLGAGDGLESAAAQLASAAETAAVFRGEYAKIPLEARYYRWNLLFWSQWLFVLSFITVAATWLFVKNRWLSRAAWIGVALPWLLLVTSIVYRCILRGRPPVTTLYETVLFITAVCVLLALIIELINRQRIAIALASGIGTLGLFLAYKYEMSERQDTMPNLVAVLDTNFWLSTHVTTVTMGYAAGLLGAFVGAVYLVARLFNLKPGNKEFYRTLSRMVYGIVCFGLFFSFIGTVLGGIWANYSWGRFWGWDPKENGALLIVLCNLGMLHARMGGYIRELGMAMASTFNGMVVAFSWWGVNLLGVGLHSYGFTSGIWGALQLYWLIQSLLLVAGVYVFVRTRIRVAAASRNPEPDSTLLPEPAAK